MFPFASEQELIDYVERRPGILVAVNAEKIIHADDELRGLINRNIGYCDGAGAVKGLRKKGHGDVSKIAGCELWLKIIERMYRERTFYLVGGRQEVIDQTVEKLRSQFDGIRIYRRRRAVRGAAGRYRTKEPRRRVRRYGLAPAGASYGAHAAAS